MAIYSLGTLAFATLLFSNVAVTSYNAWQWFVAAEVMATVIFALVGARAALNALKRRIGVVGRYLIVLAASFSTANGGGTIRDLLMYEVPFWLHNPLYIVWPTLVALLAVSVEVQARTFVKDVLSGMDLIGTGVFICLGVNVASNVLGRVDHQAFLIMGAVVGVVTAVGGGIVRDSMILRVKAAVLSTPIVLVCVFTAVAFAMATVATAGTPLQESNLFWMVVPITILCVSSVRRSGDIV